MAKGHLATISRKSGNNVQTSSDDENSSDGFQSVARFDPSAAKQENIHISYNYLLQ